jgi:hypothetical protein
MRCNRVTTGDNNKLSQITPCAPLIQCCNAMSDNRTNKHADIIRHVKLQHSDARTQWQWLPTEYNIALPTSVRAGACGSCSSRSASRPLKPRRYCSGPCRVGPCGVLGTPSALGRSRCQPRRASPAPQRGGSGSASHAASCPPGARPPSPAPTSACAAPRVAGSPKRPKARLLSPGARCADQGGGTNNLVWGQASVSEHTLEVGPRTSTPQLVCSTRWRRSCHDG